MDITEHRLQSLRDQFQAWDVEAILITSSTNRRWLSGFTGSSGRLLITRERAILATDSRYWQQAAVEVAHFELFQDRRRHEDTLSLVDLANVQRIGIEANHVTITDHVKLNSITDIVWVPLEKPLEPLRQIKIAGEIAKIRAAAKITDQVMDVVPQLLQPEITERALAWKLEKTMRDLGADATAFPIIVAFGPNSALPHHSPGDRELQQEEIILVDMGAELNGYKSDLTRTFFFGNTKSEKFSSIYNLVHAALVAATANIRPDVDTVQAHNFAMEIIANAGYRKNFQHGLGHGIGLDIHEEPFLSPYRPVTKIEAGTTITIEPGIYLPGWGGVRIEDLVLVNETGVETISKSPKVPEIHP
jgi:Xaa-Pro aminopeptidase